jgi:hypothetical protein
MHKTTGTTSDDAQAEVRTEMNKLPDDADTQGPRFEKLPTEAVVKRPTAETAALLDVDGVAGLLACSPRHVYRLADSGHGSKEGNTSRRERNRHAYHNTLGNRLLHRVMPAAEPGKVLPWCLAH